MADLDLAIKLLRRGNLEDARKLLLSFSNHDCNYLASLLYLAHISDIQCDWSDRKCKMDYLKNLYCESVKKTDSVPKFPICYLPFELNDFELIEISRLKLSTFSAIKALQRAPSRTDKLRIGIVSIDFRSHSNGVDLTPMFNSCKENGIELYGYSFSEKVHGVPHKGKLPSYFNRFMELSIQTMSEVASLIASDLIDILVDTTRNIEGSPEELFFYKPAPIQISGWGFGPSSGTDVFDYFLSGEKMVLAAEESCYPESVICLASYNPVSIEVNSLSEKGNFKIPKNKLLTFGAFGATYKLRPQLFDTWIEILRENPASRLIMVVDNQVAKNNITSYFKESGLRSDRLQILDRIESNKFEVLLTNEIDIVLDNPILGGSNAYFQAWKLGIPVVTYEAIGFSGRGSACYGTILGGGDLVAKDLSQYKAIALRLAKQELIMKSPLSVIEEYADLYFTLSSTLDSL